MIAASAETAWRAQRPAAGAVTLDHIAHFVPDMDAAADALARLGFTLTPLSVQHHRVEPGAPLTPAGTANRCAMLRTGYLEFLTPAADTPTAQRLRAAIGRYTGVHLACLGTADAPGLHAHLAAAGFAPLPPVALQRQIGTARGEATARFTVVRVPPKAMPEGRIQAVEHHTPEHLWQARWLTHANAAAALLGVLICAADPAEAAARYARFAGCGSVGRGALHVVTTARGAIVIGDAAALAARFGVAAPDPPSIAGTILRSEDMQATRDHLARAELSARELPDGAIAVAGPPALGGVFVFEAKRV